MRLNRRAAVGILLTGSSLSIAENFLAREALADRKRPSSNSSKKSAAASKEPAGDRADTNRIFVSIKDFGAVGDGVTDDTAAFQAFTRAFSGTWEEDYSRIITPGIPAELYIPPGRYFVSGDGVNQFHHGQFWGAIGLGIPRLKVHAYGVEWLSALDFDNNYGWGVQGHVTNNEGAYSAKFASSGAGATSVTLITLADHAKFRANDWVMLGCIDTQGGGQPPNQYIFEYVQIEAIDTDTGEITFVTPLQKRYFDHFPQMDDGTLGTFSDQGGAATMFYMSAGWDMELEIIGMHNLNAPSGGGHASLANARKLKFTDCRFDFGNVVSVAQEVIHDGCWFKYLGARIEIDKTITSLTYRDCEIPSGLVLQSASIENFTLDNCTCVLQGAARNNRIINSRVNSWSEGAWYGPTETIYIENSEVRNIFFQYFDGANITEISEFTFSNGTLTYAMSPGVKDMPGWAVPGAAILPVDRDSEFWFPPFLVLDVRQDGTDMKIDTTLDALPTYNVGTAGFGTPNIFMPHPCPSMTVIGCSGNNSSGTLKEHEADPHQGRPLQSYRRRIFTGTQVPFSPKLRGYLVSATFNIIRAYTGTEVGLTWSFGGNYVNMTTNDVDVWTVSLDTTTTGIRTIIPGSSGTLGADSIPVLPAAGAWFGDDVTYRMELSADITGEAACTWPIMEVIIETNHGYAEAKVLNAHGNLAW